VKAKPKAVPYGGRAQQLKAQGVGNAEIVRLAKVGAKRIVVPDRKAK